MAAITVQLATSFAIHKDDAAGTMGVQLIDGTGLDFSGGETEFRNFIAQNAGESTDASRTFLLAVLLGSLLAKDSLLDSLTDWNGKKITLDVEQAIATNVLKIV